MVYLRRFVGRGGVHECCVESDLVLVLQHTDPEHGLAQHTDPKHGHTKVLQSAGASDVVLRLMAL